MDTKFINSEAFKISVKRKHIYLTYQVDENAKLVFSLSLNYLFKIISSKCD
jgi:hypothetical protein